MGLEKFKPLNLPNDTGITIVMTLKSLQFCRWVTIAACVLISTTATTAEVSSQQRSGYQRLNFTFDKPTRVSVSSGNNNVVLRFTAPLKKSPGEIQQIVGAVATKASLSADGKTLTLTTSKRYRTRQFVSGNTVGLDLIGTADTETAQVVQEKPAEELMTTKKSTPKPIEKKVEKPRKETEKKSSKPPEKKPEVKVVENETPKAVAPASAAKEEALTTKPSAPETEILTTKEPEKPAPAEATTPEIVKEEPVAPAVAEKPPTEAEPVIVAPQGPFKVTAHGGETDATIDFPFTARTAAAVFERGNAIWLVFARAADASVAEIKRAMPKAVSEVTQFAYPGHTVLRISTNGNLHPTIAPIKESYGWVVKLSPDVAAPARDTALNADNTDEKTRLILSSYDVSDTVKFYDPNTGEMTLIVPSYEAGLGVKNIRNFPELSLLQSMQGVALAASRDDITARTTRLGIIVESPRGLAVSKMLSTLGASGQPVTGSATGVMLPYEAWHVPKDAFKETLIARQRALTESTKENRAENILSLVTLYLSEGMGAEALGYIDLLELNEPEFYKTHKVALLKIAAQVLQRHIDDAVQTMKAPELADLPEAALWREYLAMKTPTSSALQLLQQGNAPGTTMPIDTASDTETQSTEEMAATASAPTAAETTTPLQPMMRFLKYNSGFIRFYPPRIRQLLATEAADGYIANGLEEKAITTFDTLTRDNILTPLEYRAEYAVALESIKNKKLPQAVEILKRLITQNVDQETKAKARIAHTMLLMDTGAKTPEETAEELELARVTWRGDAVERDVLKTLTRIYKDSKRYDEALRSYKALVDAFPDDPDYITNTTAMSDLFELLYVQGIADEMTPLKSLSLFYEFRDLTPIGPKGDLIIQKLADRLASFDLLDRATQLLENQITYRVAGEERSRIGARLALLYILNHQPEEALKILESSNFGGNAPELQLQRMQLSAQALNALTRYEEALNMLYNDSSSDGALLKLDILWAAQDWPNVVNTAEDILAKRADLTAPLTATETEVLMKLALGYSLEGDYTQLRYLKDYYSGLLSDSAYKQIFDYITNDTAPLDREDTSLLSEQINRTEGFLNIFKEKIAAGKLSEAIK